MSEPSGGRVKQRVFDWQGANAQIEHARLRVEQSIMPTPEQEQDILRRRAIDFAKPAPAEPDDMLDLVAFACGERRYALPLADCSAIATLDDLTPLPSLPSFYLGLLNFRGSIYPVIDLRPLLGLTATGANFSHAALIRTESGCLGIAATALYGTESHSGALIAMADPASDANRIVWGVAPQHTTILDATRLLLDIRLVVDEQPDIATSNPGAMA